VNASSDISQDRPDSILVLFPGSAQSDGAVSLLSEIGVFDDYMIRNRLRSRLPVLYGPCRRSEIGEDTGRRLSDAGVRFMAVSRAYLDEPFAAFDADRCLFESERVRLWDTEDRQRDLYDREKTLVLEAVYASETRSRTERSGRKPVDVAARFEAGFGATPAAVSGERAGVLFLFPRSGDLPIRFMEENIDFGFLDERRGLTAAENFRLLRGLLDDRFGPVCRDMVSYGFSIEALTEERTEEAGRARGRVRQVKTRSNVSSVNTMARLLYCRWWQEQGWADRVFPP
jgi:hypothetical protein